MAADVARRRWPLGRWTTVLVLALGAVFVLLRVAVPTDDPPTPTTIYTSQVVVVGVEGMTGLDAADRAVVTAHAGDVQAGTIATRGRYRGACAAAGWTTLGAGRRAAVASLCDPRVVDGQIADWPARVAAAEARFGDVRMGTLAGSASGCVAAVGPGAALAAARPDGSVPDYRTLAQFSADGQRLTCPLTLVDAGPQGATSDRLVRALAARSGVTTIVTGIGPVDPADREELGVIYRLGTTLPGVLTSDSTRREGVVDLTDLTATLAVFAGRTGPGGADAAVPDGVDGSPLQVDEQPMSPAVVDTLVHRFDALSYAVITGYLANGAIGALILAAIVVAAVRRVWRLVRVGGAIACVWTAGMMLPGAFPWYDAAHPALVLTVASLGWTLALAAASLALARWTRWPVAVAGAALTVAAFTVEAALGGPMEPGSMLNSRPVYGGRWYGFGNVTFAAYAVPALVLAGYLAHRFLHHHRPHRAAAVVAVALVGALQIVCEGWPTMGTDFGGVIAMTPVVLWLALVVSGLRVTWRKLLLIAVAAVVAITAISVLDWLRGPGKRSHLGNFVQRVIDGDASSVVIRKAVTSVQTMISPLGIGSLLIGAALWVIIFRVLLPRIPADRYGTLRPTMIAVLGVAVLGTVLNDGGISVWLVGTAAAVAAAFGLAFDELAGVPLPAGNPERSRAARSGSPVHRTAPDPLHRHDRQPRRGRSGRGRDR
ncbi:hypothetical protein FHX74_000028 [Friedmanniella endophytica]|uniref:Uncharacterized protein n=1 Tax=Microlunatus kandeliicorticis TaxID=1759536 RepID=A0A7W3P411_9ACTN|nr:hypothetical protein [Microlunatus kandeliicorticis]MBA8792434.1 hypothetical protein [Microlunatus kandeliicorticis]